MKTLSIVIPVFNQLHLTKRSLVSLIKGAKHPRHLIVIDNNSTDETPAYLKELKNSKELSGWNFEVFTNPKNVGVGAAFNQGIRASREDYITLANNDTWIMPGWDEALLQAAEKLNASMVGAFYDESPFDESRTPSRALEFTKRNAGKASRDWAAIVMCFRKETFETVGLFDERYFVSYEDRDLRERMDRAGLKYYKTADCFIWHHSKGTRDAKGAGSLKPNYEQESLAKFIEKWGFDPRPADSKFSNKYRQKFIQLKNRYGFF